MSSTAQSQPFFPDWIHNMKSRGELPAVQFKHDGSWREIGWREYSERIEEFASGLLELGVQAGDRVAVFASTRYEWAISDFAILSLGAITVPVYHTMTSEELEFILEHSGAKILIVENQALLKIYKTMPKKIQAIEKLVIFDFEESMTGPATLAFHAVLDNGLGALAKNKKTIASRLKALTLDTPATIVYTSGTTGRPKGVLLVHLQLASEINEAFPYAGATHHDISLSFLPYSHVLGRIELWGSLAVGFTLAFAESIEKIRVNLREVRPTIMVAVPRIFEKIYVTIQAQIESNPIRSRLFKWALGVGKKIGNLRLQRRPVPLALIPPFEVADRLVLSKVREAFGGRLRFAISGGAPLNADIGEFFHSCGVLVLEGYGLTETTGAVAVNTPFDYVFGTVGKPIGDVQVKIAEDGEILLKSGKVMKEYYNDPESTEKAFIDGWYATGDIGEIIPTGQLRITDRKKDLIKTAGGKYVAPQKLEGLLKTQPLISNVHIHGDQRKYVVALITLDPVRLREIAQEKGLSTANLDNLTQTSYIQDSVRKSVAEANAQLASYETIKRFLILAKDFTIESGELTPSLKIKRKFVDQKFKKELDSLYV